MLPSSGEITTYMIAQEFGLATALEVQLILQRVSGILQVKIGGVWRNLNMCSPSLPKETPECTVQDWYGYNHTAIGVTSVSILGETTVLNGSTHIYTASLQGSNFAGITYQWEKYENGSWSNLGTASTQSVTWANVTGAKIKVTINNTCGGSSVSSEQNMNLACTIPSSVVISGNSNVSYNGTYTYNLVSHNGSTNNRIITWTVGTYGTIISGQGTGQISVQFDFNNGGIYDAGRTCTIKCNIANDCGNADSSNINVSPNVYGNDAVSQDFTKQCDVGYRGSTHTYTVAADTHYWYTKAVANELAGNNITSNGQNYVNNLINATCTLICIPPSNVIISGNDYCPVSYQNYSVSFSGHSTDLSYLWEVETGVIHSGQGTNTVTILIIPSDPNINLYQTNRVRCKVTNSCGESYSEWFTINLVFFGNDEYSQNFTKNNCGANQTGSTHTYTVAANSLYDIDKASANADAVWQANTYGQAWVNALPSATCTDNCIPVVFDTVPIKFNNVNPYNPTNGEALTITSNIIQGNNISYAWEITNNFNTDIITGTNSSISLTPYSTDIYSRSYTVTIRAYNNCSDVTKSHSFDIVIYGNVSMTRYFTRDNCPSNRYPGAGEYTFGANRRYAFTQVEADNLASAALDIEGQEYINNNIPCYCNSNSVNSTYLVNNTIEQFQDPQLVIELSYPENVTRIDYTRIGNSQTPPASTHNFTNASFYINTENKIIVNLVGYGDVGLWIYNEVKIYNCNGSIVTLVQNFNVWGVSVSLSPENDDVDRQGDSGSFWVTAQLDGNGENLGVEFTWQVSKVGGAGTISASSTTGTGITIFYDNTTLFGTTDVLVFVTAKTLTGRELDSVYKTYYI